MSIDAALVTAIAKINASAIANSDWYPNDTTKLAGLIAAMQRALILRPQVMSHGNAPEELRFDMATLQNELVELRKQYKQLVNTQSAAGKQRGGFRQNQLSHCGARFR